MRLKKLIKTFEFIEENRSRITLGTGARLHPTENVLCLAEPYSMAANIQAKTWITNPVNVRQWLRFEAVVQHAKDDLGQPTTSLGFRLGDGTNEYRWNGTAWVIATTGWNTEAELSSNIASFPATSRKLQIIVNLVTTVASATPKVKALKVLYASDIEFQEDLIWRSLIPELRTQLRPITDWPITLTASGTTIDLNQYKLDTPYNIVGVDSVFNHTDDSPHNVNLLQSYNPSTKVITLSSSMASGKVAWVRFYWEPEVAVTTGQEYSEIAKVPAVVLGDIKLIESADTGQEDTVANKATNEATKVPSPIMADFDMFLYGITATARDQARLADEVKRFFSNNSTIRSKGLDENFRLWLLEEYGQSAEPQQTGIQAGRLRFRIVKALFFGRDAVEMYATGRLKLVGDMNVIVENAPTGD